MCGHHRTFTIESLALGCAKVDAASGLRVIVGRTLKRVIWAHACALFLAACEGSIGGGHAFRDLSSSGPSGGASGISGSGGAAGASGASGSSGAAGTAGSDEPPPPAGCEEHPQIVPQRIVRLDHAQVEKSIIALLGEESVAEDARVDPRLREFQALFVEGRAINADVLRTTLGLAEHAAENASGRAATLAGCSGALDDACARSFLSAFASEVYRRPASADETTSLLQLFDDVKGLYASSASGGVEEAFRQAITGLLSSPAALYRTEIGAAQAGTTQTQLAPYELASMLSYFATNGPPDAELLEAAASGKLATDAGIREELTRVLATEAARANLTQAVLAYYGLKTLDSTLKDAEKFPAFTVGLRNSMYAESERFIDEALWRGKVDDLLTSRTSFVNEGLAELYGVDYPGPPGGDFMQVELPPERAGLLTRASILAMRARTDETSVVSRGLYVNGAVLCIPAPPPPPMSIQDQVDELLMDTSLTERGKADYRAGTSPCNTCHVNFDAYGLVLENYDGIGRFREAYANGDPIDTTAMLPVLAGDVAIDDVIDMVETVTQNGTFSACMTANLTKYALTDASAIDYGDCGLKQTHEAFLASGRTFSDLVLEVMAAKTLTTRTVEE